MSDTKVDRSGCYSQEIEESCRCCAVGLPHKTEIQLNGPVLHSGLIAHDLLAADGSGCRNS